MQTMTIDYAKTHFDEIIKKTDSEMEGIEIVKDKDKYILIKKEYIESMIETLYLTQDKELMESLEEAEDDFRRGDILSFEEVFDETL